MTHRLSGLLLLWTVCAAAAGDTPAIVAYRGGAAVRPENTLAAFRHALTLGVRVLEFDMNVTADDRVVIHHDTSVNPRICKAEEGSGVLAGPIRELTLEQIRRFDCGSFAREASPHFRSAPGERMPTLDEVLAAVKSSDALLLGETKMPARGGEPPARFVDLIDAAVRKHGLSRRFVLQSSDYRTIDAMRNRNPAVRLCLLNAREHKPKYLEIARRHGATHLMLRAADVTADQVRELKAAGQVLFSGTANRREEWAAYLTLQFDGILTDDPVSLREFLRDPD
jgi:glycerophosphoryl diester phosphodiesterase